MSSKLDKSSLPADELARWDSAVDTYWAVLRGNGLLATRDLAREPAAGVSGSALFRRLLEGKPAFKHPPPTSHGYPWYEVVEQPSPHAVLGVFLLYPGGVASNRISLNQCAWTIVDLNPAARKLLALDARFQADGVQTLDNDFRLEVLAAYAEGPELTVKFGSWPPFRLFVAASAPRACRRRRAEAAMRGDVARKVFTSVFSLESLYANGRITEVLLPGKRPEARAGLSIEDLATMTSQFEADPASFDIVSLVTDGWALEALTPIEDIYVTL